MNAAEHSRPSTFKAIRQEAVIAFVSRSALVTIWFLKHPIEVLHMWTSYPGFRNLDLLPGILPEGLIDCHTPGWTPIHAGSPRCDGDANPCRAEPSQTESSQSPRDVSARQHLIKVSDHSLVVQNFVTETAIGNHDNTKPEYCKTQNHDTKRSCKHIKAAVSVRELFILTVITDTVRSASILLMRWKWKKSETK